METSLTHFVKKTVPKMTCTTKNDESLDASRTQTFYNTNLIQFIS